MKEPKKPEEPIAPKEPVDYAGYRFRVIDDCLVEADKCPPYWWELEENEALRELWDKHGYSYSSAEISINLIDIIEKCVQKGCSDPTTVWASTVDVRYPGDSDTALELEVGFFEQLPADEYQAALEEYRQKKDQYDVDLKAFKKAEKQYKKDIKEYRKWKKMAKLKAELEALENEK
jgi:hypothetical protein